MQSTEFSFSFYRVWVVFFIGLGDEVLKKKLIWPIHKDASSVSANLRLKTKLFPVLPLQPVRIPRF